ncbi:MAG: GGDEF domain-containing protein [Alcanivorax sp.]
MPEHTPSAFLAGAGTDTWTLWLNIMATGAAMALLVLLSVFTLALYLYRDREASAALHFTLANLFATVYITGDLVSRIDALVGNVDGVMPPYRLALGAVVMGLAALLCFHRVLSRRREPRWRLAGIYAVGALLAGLIWVDHPALIIASDQATIRGTQVFADYGAAGAPFFALCMVLVTLINWRMLSRARRAGGSLAWWLTVIGFALVFLTGVHDTLRELGLELLPLSTLTPGFVVFQLAALAAMVIHYSRTLSERTETDYQLRHLADKATRDPLSGLFNRAFLENHLDNLGNNARGGLLFIDLDHFKVVNDRFGHARGDALLRAVAQRIDDTMRDGDIACRWGGDEFVVYLADANPDAADSIARRLLDAFQRIAPGEQDLPRIGASMGFAELTDGDWRRTLRRADQALYQAKDQGRGGVAIAS